MICKTCERDLPLDQMLVDHRKRLGVRPFCLDCNRTYQRAYYVANRDRLIAAQSRRYANDPDKRAKNRAFAIKRYGMTSERYEEMLAAQGGVCAICRGCCVTGQRLCIDHDHETGKVRALLCRKCNRYVGMVEQPDFQQYVDYVARWAPS